MMRANTDHGQRYRQIATILGRHGLGYLVGVVGLERFVPFERGLLGHARRAEPYTQPEHVRLALEELGTTFIKLGQILSTRADLLPSEYQHELAKLQDAAPPVPPEQIEETIVAEFSQPPEQVFATFDSQPLAAASIGQAHAATRRDGVEVVVKVHRPGVIEQVETDLEILQNLAITASQRWEWADRYDLVGLVQEFAETLRGELDYVREARNAERFAENFADDHTVHIPKIYWETTTSRVITLERLHGLKINDLPGLAVAGIDRQSLAEQASRILLRMVFEDGFFHADPHPGNFFIEPDGRIGLIDFGMVGGVDERLQAQLVRLLLAINSRDADRLIDVFLDLGVSRTRVDRVRLRQDLQHLMARYLDRPLGELEIGKVIEDSLAVVRRHYLEMPVNLVLLLKTAVMSEGMAAQLDPSYHLTSVLRPYAERLVLRQFSPYMWAPRLGTASLEAAELAVDLPRQVRRLIGEVERGTLQVGVRPEGMRELIERAERLVNRLILGIVSAAVLISLAVLTSVFHPPGWEDWAGLVFAIGFGIAGGLAVYLTWVVLRAGHR